MAVHVGKVVVAIRARKDQVPPTKQVTAISTKLQLPNQFQDKRTTTVVTRPAYHHQSIPHDHHRSDITMPKQATSQHYQSWREILTHFPRIQLLYDQDWREPTVIVQDPVQIPDRASDLRKTKHKVKRRQPQPLFPSQCKNSTHYDKPLETTPWTIRLD